MSELLADLHISINPRVKIEGPVGMVVNITTENADSVTAVVKVDKIFDAGSLDINMKYPQNYEFDLALLKPSKSFRIAGPVPTGFYPADEIPFKQRLQLKYAAIAILLL
ncbi:hypothetical protein BJ508DRAFT_309064 [Ascobolus immersus RN42]|uniref:Uncharacterized protein n=1 Tax=Ascobolus immersus RN42 TaxID=1160509 RepID=A0A3N4HXI6_ASCIM|nr:hypothetical protein BJ508DRAFT_309064 [Ascobolus immersus RN42]